MALLRTELTPEIEVIRHLGSGSASEVYLAREPSLKRLVALKVLSSDLVGDIVALGRFEREARAAASLNHPHAVPVFRFGYLSSGVPYLTMYFAAGGTLADRVAREGPLPVPEARRVLGQISSALAAAHHRGFVHRDVRAANILCEKEKGRVLVADFGLAGVIPGGDTEDPRLTRTGEILGLPRYTSPEQLQGEEATECSDIYALGVLGYEILTGDGPFPGTSNRELLMAHLRSPPRPNQGLRPEVDPEFARILERCLEKDPKKRPTAVHLARTLETEEDGSELPQASSGGPGGILGSLLQRRIPQVAVVTGAVGFAVLTFWGDLADRGVLPEWTYRQALNTFFCGLAAALVVGWFHGARGKQLVKLAEILLLAGIFVVWLLLALLVIPGP
ncbi:MAG: serine/threonine-protein kinase [Gemmatimonadota bacterium]